MSSKEAKPVRSWLGHQDPTVRDVLNRGRILTSINQALKAEWSHEPWIDLIRVANIRGMTLVVFVQTAAVLIPLRYKKQALLVFLGQQFQLSCTEIDIKVVPNH